MVCREEHKQLIRRRRQREKDQRVGSILEAARRVFFTKGYLRATMEEIALVAEVSKPTIYNYFRTKDELFYSLMLPVVERFQRELDIIVQRLLQRKYRSGRRLIRDLFRGFFRAYSEDPDSFQVVQLFQQTGMVGALDEGVRSLLNQKGAQAFGSARRIMEMGIQQGLIKPADVFGLVDAFWGLFLGIVQLERVKSPTKPLPPHLRSTLEVAESIFSTGTLPSQGAPYTRRRASCHEG